MRNFNYILFVMDLVIIYLPFWAVSVGAIGLSQFAIGFAVMWIFLNIRNGKVTKNRYKINGDI